MTPNENVTIRPGVRGDALPICQVRVATWRSAYRGLVPQDVLDGMSPERGVPMWQEILQRSRPPYFTFVAKDNGGRVVGFASGGPERTNDPDYRAEVAGLYVLEEYQRRGIGRQLFAAAVRALLDAQMNSMLVWVLADNPCRRFYESLRGQYLREKTVTVGGHDLQEAAYGWHDIRPLLVRP